MDIERLKRLIENFRAVYGYNIDKIAEITGVSRATIGRIEQGVANPNWETINKIYDGLNTYAVNNDHLDFLKFEGVSSLEEFNNIINFNEYMLNTLNYDFRLDRSYPWGTVMIISDKEQKVFFNVKPNDLKRIMNKTFEYYEKLILEEYPFDIFSKNENTQE